MKILQVLEANLLLSLSTITYYHSTIVIVCYSDILIWIIANSDSNPNNDSGYYYPSVIMIK